MTHEIMEALTLELQSLGYSVSYENYDLVPVTIDVTRNGKTLVIAATETGVEIVYEDQSLDDFIEFDFAAPGSLDKLLKEIERVCSA